MNLSTSGAQRIQLDQASWIEHMPGWLPATAAAALLTSLTCKRSECIVPVLSLGAPRRFLIKPRPSGPASASPRQAAT